MNCLSTQDIRRVTVFISFHDRTCNLLLIALQQTAKQDTFAEKLVANVIKNLEVKISNIHVRYEDEISNVDRSFSVGVTLKELTFLVSCYSSSLNISDGQRLTVSSSWRKVLGLQESSSKPTTISYRQRSATLIAISNSDLWWAATEYQQPPAKVCVIVTNSDCRHWPDKVDDESN